MNKGDLGSADGEPPVERVCHLAEERRWRSSREWSNWTDRDGHFNNQEAIRASRSADAILKIRGRLTKQEETNALWDGYWYCKERRDEYRERVAVEVQNWFDNSEFNHA